MKYPDQTEVSVGDHIWWNEGSCVGFICTIVESETDQDSWGLEGPHILLSGRHPHDPDDSGYIAYSISDFEDEAIERLSSADEEDFERAAALARSKAGFHQPFHAGLDVLSHEDGIWMFSTEQGENFSEFTRIKREK